MAMSGDDAFAPDDAIAAGADGFIEKPITSISAFQKMILSRLPDDEQPSNLRPVGEDVVIPDRLGYRDDLSLAAELLCPDPDARTLDYLTGFLVGVAKSAQDSALQTAVRDVADARDAGLAALNAQVSTLRTLIDDRLREDQAV